MCDDTQYRTHGGITSNGCDLSAIANANVQMSPGDIERLDRVREWIEKTGRAVSIGRGTTTPEPEAIAAPATPIEEPEMNNTEYAESFILTTLRHTPVSKRACKGDPPTLSELGRRVARVLRSLYAGLHHMRPSVIRAVNWSDPRVIQVRHPGELASWDGNDLTNLLVLCHDECLRVSVSPLNMRYMRLMFHPRKREGKTWERHPTIEQHIEMIRELQE